MTNKGQQRKRQAVVIALSVAAAFTVLPAIKSFSQEMFRPTANVRDYGAVGDGVTNDTAAIQRANDAVAAQGGGVVYFPAPGTYKAAGIFLDSNVEATGDPGATLKHVDGHSGGHLITSRVLTKKGSVPEGTNKVDVLDTQGVVPGSNIAIRGAGGASTVQYASLSLPLLAGAKSFSVTKSNGWGQYLNYVLIDDEIVSYTSFSGTSATGVKRGLLGTTSVTHAKGARVSQLNVLYAKVASVGSNVIWLDRVAVQGVASSDVYIGSMNVTVRGLTLDGSRVPGGSPNNPMPVFFDLARGSRVEGCTIRNGDHGAVSFNKGTTESSVVGNTLLDNGSPAERLGAAVWLFRGATDNTVSGNTIGGDSYQGIMPDDRTQLSSEWDAPSDRNVLIGNRIDIPNKAYWNSAIYLAGGEGNVVENNDIRSTYFGVHIAKSEQGTLPAITRGNVVRNNQVAAVDFGLYVTGAENWLERNQLTGVPNPITDQGSGNQFIENLIAAAPAV